MLKLSYILPIVAILASCSPKLTKVGSSQKLVKITANNQSELDSVAFKTILPYKNQLESKMNEVIGLTESDLIKKLPTGSLGSLFCDAMMDYNKRVNNTLTAADFCLMNHGGIRIGSIGKGQITVNTAYELMPFENELVILALDGKYCLDLFNTIAEGGGAPVSGVRFKIVDNKPTDIFINGNAFNINNTYYVLTSDYLANGGDKADAMKHAIKQIPLGVKIRDAFIDELKHKHKNGITLQAPTDERITN